MPRKLTKDQKYNRKRRKDGNKDFRRISKEGDFDGVRVTRKQIAFYISNEASERLQQMADDAEIFKWEMASRMILKGLPGIQSSGYASLRNPEAINRYEWNVLYLEPVIKRIHYRSSKADKRVTIDVTSTAWNKIHCHSTATERSISQIFQSLCLNYKPLSNEQREKSNIAKEEYLRNQEVPKDMKTSRHYKSYKKSSKFLDIGFDLIHVKGIPIEHWDGAEFNEYCELMEKKFKELNRHIDEGKKHNDELFGNLQSSTKESEE
ncbi:hypothetical protein N9996_04360 [Synechococcus sp. AH-603-M21]|nr:hypothetical protein [Synechococcus sp. AH-603-M21]